MTHAQDSTAAEINATELLTYLSSSKIDDGTWRGKANDYILHWKEPLRLYNEFGKPLEQLIDIVGKDRVVSLYATPRGM